MNPAILGKGITCVIKYAVIAFIPITLRKKDHFTFFLCQLSNKKEPSENNTEETNTKVEDQIFLTIG